jgi:hypothetical protein
LPSAASLEEFLAIAQIDKRLDFYATRWTVHREISRTLSLLDTPSELVQLHFVAAGTVLPLGWQEESGDPCLEFHAPSGAADLRSRRAFAHLLSASLAGSTGARVARRDPNSYSIAVTVRVSGLVLLFGGDVVNGGPAWGWRHIVTFLDRNRPADVFKVAHHGSKPAHLQELWNDHLKSECACLISPYRPSGLPGDEDIQRMHQTHNPVYVTASPKNIAPSAKVRTTAGLLPMAHDVHEVGGVQGQVRWRCEPGGLPVIDVISPAREA